MINLFKSNNIKVKVHLIEDESEKNNNNGFDILLFPEAMK
jgi:hypothetical protein